MPHQIYKLNVIYRDRRTTLYYLARGKGRHFAGYATSLRQIHTTLNHTFGGPGLELHYVYDRRMHELRTDENLLRALRHSDGSSLTMHAYDKRPFNSIWNFPGKHQDEPIYISSSLANCSHSQCYRCRRSCSNRTACVHAHKSGYKLCERCYRNLKCWNKISWKKPVAVVNAGNIAAGVPHAPLPKNITSVRQLQNILVKLGYCKASDAFGSFTHVVSKTEAGVVKFRRQYRINGKDMREYDLRTERILAQVVRKYQTKGQKYL